MNFPIWVIVCLCAAVVLGPLMLLKPTPAERRLKKLREVAMQRRLGIQLKQISLPYEVTGGRPREIPVAAYSMGFSWKSRDRFLKPFFQVFQLNGRQATVVRDLDVKPFEIFLAHLGATDLSIVSVAVAPEVVTACWKEDGDFGAVREIINLLEEARDSFVEALNA
jgi:hypothetical protein